MKYAGQLVETLQKRSMRNVLNSDFSIVLKSFFPLITMIYANYNS